MGIGNLHARSRTRATCMSKIRRQPARDIALNILCLHLFATHARLIGHDWYTRMKCMLCGVSETSLRSSAGRLMDALPTTWREHMGIRVDMQSFAERADSRVLKRLARLCGA
eukprot:6204205-Pleurochrysis_carterae.AAC.1